MEIWIEPTRIITEGEQRWPAYRRNEREYRKARTQIVPSNQVLDTRNKAMQHMLQPSKQDSQVTVPNTVAVNNRAATLTAVAESNELQPQHNQIKGENIHPSFPWSDGYKLTLYVRWRPCPSSMLQIAEVIKLHTKQTPNYHRKLWEVLFAKRLEQLLLSF